MSDDLVKRHRDECEFKFAPLDVCDCVRKNMAERIEELEDKLAKAVEALQFYAMRDASYLNDETATFQDYVDIVRSSTFSDLWPSPPSQD